MKNENFKKLFFTLVNFNFFVFNLNKINKYNANLNFFLFNINRTFLTKKKNNFPIF